VVAPNLPSQPTPFIGREDELAEIANLLGMPACRLLTLVGPGGIGKTRLAIEAVRPIILPDGVHFVPLQPLNSPDFIVSTIADALNFTFYGEQDPKTQLLHYLREKHLLLVLDNFEHLLGGVDLLPEVLEQSPGVKLLVTSRERLRLREEWVFDIAGLAFPENGHSAALVDYSAAQLFVQNARRAGYAPQPTDAASILRICQLVEGMPLALELAAAWTRVLPIAKIADEIERSLDILETTLRNVPEKHHSMHAAFEHSWLLLTDEEQTVFRRLSVFIGGFIQQAAQEVAGASLRALAVLVDKSLLRVDANGRYDLHELLRQYAREKLTAASEAQAVSDRHLVYFLTFADSAEQELFGAHQIDWLNRVEAELGNLRAAIGWSLEIGDIAASLRLTTWPYWFWTQHRYHFVDYKRFVDILSLPQAHVRTTVRAKALNAAGYFQLFEGNYPEARRLLEEALDIAREVGDLRELTRAGLSLGPVLYSLGEHEAAGDLLEESLALARQLQDRFGIAWSLMFLGDVVLQRGNTERAHQLYQESIDLCRALEERVLLPYPLRRLGLVMRGYGDFERTRALCQESLKLNVALGDRRFVAASLVGLAGLAITEGHGIRAAQLLSTAERLLNAIGVHLLIVDQVEYEHHLRSVRNQLDTAAFDRAWAEGQSMTMEKAVAYALHSHEPVVAQPSHAPTQPLADPLSPRELEILGLFASDLSTREVAQNLFITVGTVKWYLNQIYSKLSVHSRIQAIARARELKLLT